MVAAALGLLAGACSSDDGSTASTSTDRSAPSLSSSSSDSTSPAPTPTIPAGSKECDGANALAGWPTTTAPWPGAYDCIVDAMASGTPAWMVLVTAGEGVSGRTTADGYDLPTRRVVTWVVLGEGQLQQTTDLTDEGGTVTTEMCTGLSTSSGYQPPIPTGCAPA